MATPEPPREDIFLPAGNLCAECLSGPTQEVLREALKLARETRWDSVRSPHIFMGLLAVPDPGVRSWGERLGADLTRLLSQFQELFHQEKASAKRCCSSIASFFPTTSSAFFVKRMPGRVTINAESSRRWICSSVC